MAAVTNAEMLLEDFYIDEQTVRAWADFSGDHNRLHVDPEFAATTSYGRCIAHGPILASMVGEYLAAHVGAPWATSSQLRFRFVGPVFVPSRITARVEIAPGSQPGAHVECTDEEGTTVLVVEARWRNDE